MCVCQRHLFRLCGEELGPSAAPQERFGGQFLSISCWGWGLGRGTWSMREGGTPWEPILLSLLERRVRKEQGKPCSIGAWLCCVFSSNSVTRYHRQKCVKSSVELVTVPLGLVLSVRCSPLNFCELGLSKSLYYPKAPGAYFLVSIHRIIGMHVCPTVTVQLYCMLLGRSGILDWNNCLP